MIQDSVRAGVLANASAVRIGPFIVRYDAGWSSRYANYAVPDRAARPTAADVGALIEHFRGLDRIPRLEFQPADAPAVEPALLAAGFVEEDRAPVMVCRPGDPAGPAGGTPVPAPYIEGIELRATTDDADLRQAAMVQHVAYGEEGEFGEGEIDWLRVTARRGGVVVVATAVGAQGAGAVGAGVCSPLRGGISEMTGVAVAQPWRHRGIGAALAACLTSEAFARGAGTVWLEPANGEVERMYARIGFRTVAEKLNIALP
ncbi:MAG TPA: GNAT family N-acetyltransferase [Actinocrinis sp.]|jgi:ribosomal protein S18 acetylase RimI-like enzyme